MLEVRIYKTKMDKRVPILSCTVPCFHKAEYADIVALVQKKFPTNQGFRIEAEDIELVKTDYLKATKEEG